MGHVARAEEYVMPKASRDFHPGMGRAVAERTVLRKDADGNWESWEDVADRVAKGNAFLRKGFDGNNVVAAEYHNLRNHLRSATVLMSGRHLQHGDETQPTRNKELFTNCCSAATAFLKFYMLMNGSGVGRCYDDDMMLIDWDNAPALRCVISHEHPNFDWSAHESVRDALHKYGPDSRTVTWFKVPDSREGWAQALERLEVMAFEKINKDKMLILDFSLVRAAGTPIKGMQNRPASGPVVLMNAFMKAISVKGAKMKPWKQAMYVDHYFSECVLVGGARRAASMSTKSWRDPDILEFIEIKRPIEFDGKTDEQIAALRTTKRSFGFLWSSNNSVTVDAEFWRLLDLKKGYEEYSSAEAKHARRVFKTIMRCAYVDGTGEPGIINVDRLVQNDEGWDKIVGSTYVGGRRFQIHEDSELLMHKLARVAKRKKNPYIVNPCGEIVLSVLGGYCTVGTVVPYHAETLDEAEDAFRACTRALMRVNQMDCVYNAESKRTERIGVSMTGVHEFAWKFFGVGFRDLINPDFSGDGEYDSLFPRRNAGMFWKALERFRLAVEDEATKYAKHLGVTVPHTCITVKPEGTISKLFGLSEGWHLPPMEFYLRWVQFKSDDPLVAKYEEAGYPTRSLKTYEGTTIVGFPTAPVLATLGLGEHLVTAAQATPEEQYKWLMLGEKYWLGPSKGNQISYTLKYDPKKVTQEELTKTVDKYQREIRCCTVMPQEDTSSYEYTPEEAVSKIEYERLLCAVESMREDIDKVHVDCAGGSCPVDFTKEVVVELTA